MDFLKRLLGGGSIGRPVEAPPVSQHTQQEIDEEERHRERELALFEQQRLDDLRQRQLRFAHRSWTPPAEGGLERADDAERDRAERTDAEDTAS